MNFLPQLRSSCRLDRLMLAATLMVSLGVRAEAQQPAPPQQPTQPTQPQQQPIKPEQPRTTPDSPGMPDRPFNDLFVGGRRRGMGTTTMSFTFAGYGGYDSNVVGDQGVASAGIDPRAQGGGSSMLGGDAGFQYVTTKRRASFSVNAAGSYRYFPDKSSLSTTGVNGGVGAQFVLGRRTQLRLDQGFAYQPYYQLGLFPGLGEPGADLGAAVPSNLDFVVLRRQSIVSTSSASIEQSLSRRSTLTFNGQYFRQTLDNPTAPTTPTTPTTTGDLTGVVLPATGTTNTTNTSTFSNEDVQGYTAGVHYRWQATRYVSLRLGDEYRRFTYPNATQRVLQGNNIDAGVDYSRSLPFSRHTTLSFRTGTAIVDIDGRRYGNVTGSASLTHMFNRNWQSALSYNRDMSFVQTLAAPLFGDSASASLQGIIGRRTFVGLTGGFMSGRLGYSKSEADSSKLNTGTGAFQLAYAFTNNLRATFDYSYFTYHFSETALLPQGLRPSFDRHSVRGGLQLVLPVIR